MVKWLLLILFFLYFSGRLIRRFYEVQTGHDEVHYAETDDGFLLALYRYRPEKPDPDKLPVICCHGFSETRGCFDLPGRSLPRYLNRQGFEAWVVELRGQGDSRRRKGGEPFHWRWNFDDHAFRDVPAVLDKVLRVSGAPKAHWVGHSMGGMVTYAFLSRHGRDDRLSRAVTMGSPGSFSGYNRVLRRGVVVEPLLRPLGRLPLHFLITMTLVLSEAGLLRLGFIANRRNLRGRGFMYYLVNALEDAGMGLTSQFAGFVRAGRFASTRPGGFDYEENLGNIRTPMLLVSGARDLLVSPARVRRVYQAISSKEKRFLRLGLREDGTKEILDFRLAASESEREWETFLTDLYRRGLTEEGLELIVTDGGKGMLAALPTVYPGVPVQRCWAHKARNVGDKVKEADRETVKRGLRRIYGAKNRVKARSAARRFADRWDSIDKTSMERILFAVFIHENQQQGTGTPFPALTHNS